MLMHCLSHMWSENLNRGGSGSRRAGWERSGDEAVALWRGGPQCTMLELTRTATGSDLGATSNAAPAADIANQSQNSSLLSQAMSWTSSGSHDWLIGSDL